MTWHSSSCSQRHTEDKPITANQKACQSVSRCRLLCSMDQGNLMEREWSINQENLMSHLTWLVLTATFLKHPNWASGQWIRETWWARQLERTDQDSTWRAKTDDYRGISRKSRSSWTPSSSRRRRAPTPTKTIMATELGISWSSSTKSYRKGRITEISVFYLRYDHETKAHRGPEHYFGIIRQSTGTAERSKLHERF